MVKNHLRVAALLLAAALCLSACGASSGSTYDYAATEEGMAYSAASSNGYSNKVMMLANDDYDTQSAEAEEYEVDSIASGEGIFEAEQNTERKIVYTGSMSLQTKEFDTALAAITKLVTESGGYISSQQTNGRSLTNNSGYYSRYASLTVRVPADKFESLMTGVSGICNVTERSVWTDDITDSYYDSEAHLKTLELQEERLLDILAKADKLEDVIKLEEALSDVRYEIESLTAQLRRMDNSVSYSTLTLDLNEVVEYSEMTTEPESFTDKLSAAAKRSGRQISDFFENLVLWVVEDLPLVLLWSVLILAVLWVVVRVLRLVFKKKTPAEYAEKKPRKPFILPWKKKKDSNIVPDDTPHDEEK